MQTTVVETRNIIGHPLNSYLRPWFFPNQDKEQVRRAMEKKGHKEAKGNLSSFFEFQFSERFDEHGNPKAKPKEY